MIKYICDVCGKEMKGRNEYEDGNFSLGTDKEYEFCKSCVIIARKLRKDLMERQEKMTEKLGLKLLEMIKKEKK